MKKNILIIGGSKGIGAAIAQQLLEKGHHIIIIARTKPEFEGDFDYMKGDVLADELPEIDVPLHGLAYCPGSINLKPFRGLKEKDFREDLEINLMGAVKALQQYHANLKKADKASVVLFSTVAVQTGMAFHASIAAAKGAIEGLTRSLAAEWSPAIRVNAIAPSLTQTDLASRLLRNEKQIEASNQRHPLQRIGQAADIANAATFLLTEQSDWVTGQVIQVDGGMSGIRKI